MCKLKAVSGGLRPILTVWEGQDGMDAGVQSRQALQRRELVLGVFPGAGPASAHHAGGVDPAGTLDTAAPLGLEGGGRRETIRDTTSVRLGQLDHYIRDHDGILVITDWK